MNITNELQFQTAASNLNNAIKKTIKEKVPTTKPSPHAKRWWTKDLTMMMKEKNKLSGQSYKLRGLPDHPIHEEHCKFRNKVTETIHKTKQEHWIDYLEDLNQQSIYTANKYVSSPSGDGGRTSIPVVTI